MRRGLAAFAATLLTVPAPTQGPLPDRPPRVTSGVTTYVVDGETIPRIICPDRITTFVHVGTGVRVSPTEVATAYHVVERLQCFVDGKPATTTHVDERLDFAILKVAPAPLYTKVDCQRPKNRAAHLSVGYAEGSRKLRIEPAFATRDRAPDDVRSMQVYEGKAIEAMSGGPVIDIATGQPVGIVNMRLKGWPTRWRMAGTLFADTVLCEHKKGPPLRGAKAVVL